MKHWEILKERRHKHLKDKYTIKEYHEVWRGLRLAMLPTSYLIQLITAVLACALPAYAVQVLTGSWVYGFAVGAVIMLLFEYIKRTIVNNTVLSYFNGKGISIVGSLAVLSVLCLSVASSGIGTPILVENFAPMPETPNESIIVDKYKTAKDSTKDYWSSLESSALIAAKEVHSRNNWKGVTVKGARSTVLGFKDQAKAAKDSLTKDLSLLTAKQDAELTKLWDSYDSDSKDRTVQKSNVGFWLMWVTLFLELCFIGCYAWLNYFDFVEAANLGLVGGQSEAKLEIVRPVVSQTSNKVKDSATKIAAEHPPNNIGFNNEGRIVNQGTKLSIVCRTHKGELKFYDSSKLSTIIRQGGSRSDYWQDMKSKLDAAKEV